MPNWCHNTYKVVGKKEEIQSLHATLQTLQHSKRSRVENGFGRMWLGNVIDALGGNWENFQCRGEITDFYMDGEILVIYQCTAWCEQEGFRHFLLAKFPSIKVYYCEEEPGCEVYNTNDMTGDYFPEKYLLDSDDKHEYYETLETVASDVKKLTGQEVHTIEEINKALDVYNEQHEAEDKFCCFHEFKYTEE